jgi:hypothetical protein
MNPDSSMIRPSFIANQEIPIWVVITGNIRSGKEFKQIFQQIFRLRENKLIDGILFATWKNELDQAPGLEQVLVNSGVSILEIEPPIVDPKIHPLFHGYVYHQRKALHFALRSLPFNCFVLKARTDFAEERFASMVQTLFRGQDVKLETGISSPILQTRLFTYDARPDFFFYWDDIVFSGMRDDLIQLNNFDIACDFTQPGHFTPAESRLFAPLFLKHYPILQWFFENISGEKFAQLLHCWSLCTEQRPLPALIVDILASYFHIVSRYTILPNPDFLPEATISLHDFFRPNSNLGIKEFSHPWKSHKLYNHFLLEQLRKPGNILDENLTLIEHAIYEMDSNVKARGAMPLDFEQKRKDLEEFARHFECQPFVCQINLTSAAPAAPVEVFENSLEQITMPEKRHLSWIQQKKLGARKSTANWLLRKLL